MSREATRRYGPAIFLQLIVGVVVLCAFGVMALVLILLSVLLGGSIVGRLVPALLVALAAIWVLGGTLARYADSLRTVGDNGELAVAACRRQFLLALLGSAPVLVLCVWMLHGSEWL